MNGIRLSEALAAISLTTDLATGVGFEKGLQACAVASALADAIELPLAEQRTVHLGALLRSIGCTSHASENGAHFGDDVAFEATLRVLDPGDPDVFDAQLARFGEWAGAEQQPVLARRFLAIAPTVGPRAARAGCEASATLCARLDLPADVARTLAEVFERWDGRGIPDGVSGESISLPGRIVPLAEQAVLAHAQGGRQAALAEIDRRAGGHLDPELCAALARHADAVLAPLDAPDPLAEVLAREPPPAARIAAAKLERLAFALASIADLKGAWLTGHSPAVAGLADAAAGFAGLDDAARAELRIAALLHDIGRAGVPSSVWDRAGLLGPADTERLRLHAYWTGRVLERVPALAGLAPIAAAAARLRIGHLADDAGGPPGEAGLMSTATATATAPAAVAADIYAAFGRGDIPAILDHLAERVEWDAFPDSFAARAGVAALMPRRGPAEVAEFFAEVASWSPRHFDVQEIVGDGHTAIARIVAEFERPDGGAFRDEELHLWRVGEDGRVVEFRHYVDTAKHIAAARGEDTRR